MKKAHTLWKKTYQFKLANHIKRYRIYLDQTRRTNIVLCTIWHTLKRINIHTYVRTHKVYFTYEQSSTTIDIKIILVFAYAKCVREFTVKRFFYSCELKKERKKEINSSSKPMKRSECVYILVNHTIQSSIQYTFRVGWNLERKKLSL